MLPFAVKSIIKNQPVDQADESMPIKTYHQIPQRRPQTPLLDTIASPADLNALSDDALVTLCDELRHYLLYSAGVSGGHFGANLGVVELTVALHCVLDTPRDRLVWDVGHQAYAHKVLTGRREQLPSIRSQGGLTAFPERAESEYDTFGVGHSSTSISAALGMALALKYQQDKRQVACVIGDGAMTAGMAFEAMNDAVHHDANMLVVLNDNDMSISNSIGGFSKHLASLWHSGYQVDISTQGEPQLQPRPDMSFAERRSVPDIAENLFKAIGFHYFGPFDGHDLPELLRVLRRLERVIGPKLLHVYTTKGKGFQPAEADPIGYHAISKLPKPDTALEQATSRAMSPSLTHAKKYSAVFGEFLCDTAKTEQQAGHASRLMAITPAMCEGSGMVAFAKDYPEQFFDVAIAEQHALTLAAGMACEHLKPVVAIYSTFLQRGYDQLIHDVALQNLDVTFAIDRAGLVGEDGATHAGVFDYAYMRCLPNVVIMAPKDENECYQMLHTAYAYEGVAAVRYPRGLGVGAEIVKPAQAIEIGKSEVVFDSAPEMTGDGANSLAEGAKKIALVAFGSMVSPNVTVAQRLAAEGHVVTVVNMRFIKPLDTAVITQLVEQGYILVTLEEHAVMAGAGSAVNEFVMTLGQSVRVKNLGIPDRYIAHGSHAQQLADVGLDVDGILTSVQAVIHTDV